MNKKFELSLKEMIEEEYPSMSFPLIIPDTSAWCFTFSNVPYLCAITIGVERELEKKSEVIGLDRIAYNSHVFQPQVITNRFLDNDEKLIYSAKPKRDKRKKKNNGGNISKVDAYQVALAMEHAREIGDVILLTNDSDIKRTVDNLKQYPSLAYVREHIGVIVPKDFIMRQHSDLLDNLKGTDKQIAYQVIEREYMKITPEDVEEIYTQAV